MMDKEIIRQNLSSLSGEDKIKIWNRFVEAQSCAKSDKGLMAFAVMANTRVNVGIMADAIKVDAMDVVFSTSYNREDGYIAAEDGHVYSLNRNDAFALADVNLRIDFVEACAHHVKTAVELYEEYFSTKDEKPAESNKDSEEYNSDKNYFKCVYTWKDGKPSVEVETTDDNGELIKRSYTDKDAEDAWKMVKEKMEKDNKSDRPFGDFLNPFDKYFNDRFFGDFKGFLPW